jgi:hypothetical protein
MEEAQMVAKLSNHARIVHALEALASGNSRGFEDVLWLGFGDQWVPLRERLVRRRLVKYVAKSDEYVITERGRSALGSARVDEVEEARAP